MYATPHPYLPLRSSDLGVKRIHVLEKIVQISNLKFMAGKSITRQ